MDDKFKSLGFSDFITVDYAQMNDELIAYRRKRLKNGAMHEGLDEVLSRQQHIKASQRMKRMGKRIQRAKERALKRAPTMDVIKKRAQKQARTQMLKKWTRGQDKSDLSVGRRADLEKRLKKSKSKVDRMAKKLVPQIRKQDRERRAGAGKKDD